MYEEGKPVFDYYPKLNTKFSDFAPFDDDTYQRELAVNWDLMRERIEDRRFSLALVRYFQAVDGIHTAGLDGDESSLNQHELAELFSGIFPR